MRIARALSLALMLGGLVLPVAAPAPAAGVGPLPACQLLDVPTEPRDYADWAVTLVDWNLTLGPDYKPPGLVSVLTAGVSGEGYVRKVAVADLEAMAAAASNNGTPLASRSAYRGYQQQKQLFNYYARGYGYDEAITFSARPGHSEHQLGLAIDFGSVGGHGLNHHWEETKTGSWMAANAWKFGWLMSYPNGKQDLVCYSYEPWHYRYVGRELAKMIHDSGLTIREYLWANDTQVGDEAGPPLATATSEPAPSASPGAATAGDASPAPTVAPTALGSLAASSSAPTAPSVPLEDAGNVAEIGPFLIGGVILLLFVGLAGWVALGRRPRRR